MSKLENLRSEFLQGQLNDADVLKHPMEQFKLWLNEAKNSNLHDINSMFLATTANNQPTVRTVYWREIVEEGVIFYTNYNSTKGRAIAANPNVSLLFYWGVLERQVRIQGKAEKVSKEKSLAYFQSRPKGSQIASTASLQSSELASRKELEDKAKQLDEEHKEAENLPLPNNWGGYIVKPNYFEFWQGREKRMHDRIVFEQSENDWNIKRLYP